MTTRLTKPQLDELKRVAREPQPTFGRHRVRVQNSLHGKSLVRFMRAGEVLSEGAFASTCEITDAGRSVLIANGVR